MDRQAMAHDATTQAVIEVSDEASEFLNNVNLHGNEDETMLEELRLPGKKFRVIKCQYMVFCFHLMKMSFS